MIHNNNKDHGISDYDIRDYNEIKTKSKSIIIRYKNDNTEKYQSICSGVVVQLSSHSLVSQVRFPLLYCPVQGPNVHFHCPCSSL